jgi:hypothetical protein
MEPLAVWTGTEMIVSGGSRGEYKPLPRDGAAYRLADDSWRLIRPQPKAGASGWHAVWDGERMLAFWYLPSAAGMGPWIHAVAAYDPLTDRWTMHPREGSSWFSAMAAVWTGEELIVLGVDDSSPVGVVQGMAYDPTEDAWRDIAPLPESARFGYSAVWTGSEVLVWGGQETGPGPLNEGGWAYSPSTDGWRRLASSPLSPRTGHAAVWTGSEMIVYGGTTTTDSNREFDAGSILGDAAAYDPATDTWRMLPPPPIDPRIPVVAVFAGGSAIFWGGATCPGPQGDYPFCAWVTAGDGVAFDVSSDSWIVIAPSPLGAREQPAAVVSGDVVIIWGGLGSTPDGTVGLKDGGIYDPAANAWLPPH